MNQSSTIKRFSAAFLLLLFSFCVTPKRFLHDMLADHQDAQTSLTHPFEQIAATGFHCHIDDLVVVAPFLPGIQSIDPHIIHTSGIQYTEPRASFIYSFAILSDSRGPPAAFCS